jgi:hypothetical protein
MVSDALGIFNNQKKFYGVEGSRTLDLRVANATLSQLSYNPLVLRRYYSPSFFANLR